MAWKAVTKKTKALQKLQRFRSWQELGSGKSVQTIRMVTTIARQTGPTKDFQAEADGYVTILQSVTPVATIASNMAGTVNFFSNHSKCLVSK